MTSLNEKLGKIYGDRPGRDQAPSWIPKRMGDDPIRQLRRTMPQATELSETRAESLLVDQSTREVAVLLIREDAEKTLLELCGEDKLAVKMEHFDTSWGSIMEDLYGEYGPQLLEAMLEMANEGELVGYDGYIDKKALKKRLKSLRKRARRGD